MKAVFQVNEDASRPLFRSLDKDASGLLSLSELAIGLAMMVEGTEEVGDFGRQCC